MTRSSWAIVVALAAVSACEQRDPLYCPGHMEDPRCSLESDGAWSRGGVGIAVTCWMQTSSAFLPSNTGLPVTRK